MLDPTKKRYPTSKDKGDAHQTGMKSHLESNPIPARDAQRAQTKLCVHWDPESPERLSQTSSECLSVSYGGMGQQWPATATGALGVATWDTQCVA